MTKFSATLLLSSLIAAPHVFAQTPSSAPDNAKSKAAAADKNATADSQSNTAQDLDLTTRIRQSVMADSSLSTSAHNVTIVTIGGKVTLSGEVRSQDEKKAVEMKAVSLAGKDKVTSELKVATVGK